MTEKNILHQIVLLPIFSAVYLKKVGVHCEEKEEQNKKNGN